MFLAGVGFLLFVTFQRFLFVFLVFGFTFRKEQKGQPRMKGSFEGPSNFDELGKMLLFNVLSWV